jgi:hypothetical protein
MFSKNPRPKDGALEQGLYKRPTLPQLAFVRARNSNGLLGGSVSDSCQPIFNDPEQTRTARQLARATLPKIIFRHGPFSSSVHRTAVSTLTAKVTIRKPKQTMGTITLKKALVNCHLQRMFTFRFYLMNQMEMVSQG